jgi:hypothetical protein
MSQSLLPDKTLGHLMEIVFYQKRPHKSKPELNYYSYNLRRDQKESSYPVNSLKDLDIGNCYSVGSMLSPVVINRLKNELSLIKAANAPVFGSGNTPHINDKTNNKLENLPGLIDELIKVNSKKGVVPVATQIKMMPYSSALNELVDFIEVDEQQLANLMQFLNAYIEKYSSKDLRGQGRIAQPSYYSDPLYKKLTSDGYIAKNGLKNTLLAERELDDQFCHSLLYLWHQNKISISSLTIRPITNGSWIEAGSGGSNHAYQWEAIVSIDQNKAVIGLDSSEVIVGKNQIEFLKSKLNNVGNKKPDLKIKNNTKVKQETKINKVNEVDLPLGVNWKDNGKIFKLSINGKVEIEYEDKKVPTAQYLELLVKLYPESVTHEYALNKIRAATNKDQIRGYKRNIDKKLATNKIKVQTDYDGGYKLYFS